MARQHAWIKQVTMPNRRPTFMVAVESSVIPGTYTTLPNGSPSHGQAVKYAASQGYDILDGECTLPRMGAARPNRIEPEATKAELRNLMRGIEK